MYNSHSKRIATIVVTHNRKDMLRNCIRALLNQTHPCDIIVVDNASTDDTQACLHDEGFIGHDRIRYFRLDENSGGAGGFYHGLKYAMSHGWEWFWLMDDDAQPDPSALNNLVQHAKHSNTIYGSVALGIENGKKRLCWTKKVIDNGELTSIHDYEMLKDIHEVTNLAFLGFFIHRNMIQLIGLPDPTFFICRDDYEYCERARKCGARILLIKNSHIYHPVKGTTSFRCLGVHICYRTMSPQKTYYDVRNRILLTKTHYPSILWSRAIPGILFRCAYNILAFSNKRRHLQAYATGIFDGLRNRRGRRLLP